VTWWVSALPERALTGHLFFDPTDGASGTCGMSRFGPALRLAAATMARTSASSFWLS